MSDHASNMFLENNQKWQKQREYVLQNSVYYKKCWNGLKVPLNLADIGALPFTTKTDLRHSQLNCPPFGDYLASNQSDVVRLHRTSGTTGQAMNLALSEYDSEVTERLGARCQSRAGLNREHTVVHCLNYQLWMGGLTDHRTLEKTGATVVPFGVGNSRLLIQTILDLGINVISCTPSYPSVLEKTIREYFPQLDPADLGLEIGLFGGEPGLDDPVFKNKLRDTWGMEARNANYGVTDVMCNFAGQCALDGDLHFQADDYLHKEIIDPESLKNLPLESGVRGELVLTHLDRECQPLVRFRTADIVQINSMEPCSCGFKGMRFQVIGRSDDMIVVRGINIFPTMVAEIINSFDELGGNYRIILNAKPPYDFLPVTAESTSADRLVRKDLTDRFEQLFKLKLGATAQLTLVEPGYFELTEGKTSRV